MLIKIKCYIFKFIYWIINRMFRIKSIFEITSLIVIPILYLFNNYIPIIRETFIKLMEMYFILGFIILLYKLFFKDTKDEFHLQISRFHTQVKDDNSEYERRRHFGQSFFIDKINKSELIDRFYRGIVQLDKGKYYTRSHEVIVKSLLRTLKREQGIDLIKGSNNWHMVSFINSVAFIKIIEDKEENFVYERILSLPFKKIANTKSKNYLILINVT